jgi:very-short-patch-repair endonuclease
MPHTIRLFEGMPFDECQTFSVGKSVTVVDEPNEELRLAGVYERLRLKLLDLSKKNRMLNYSLGTRSKRHLQVVDEVMEEVYRKLAGEDASLRIDPLDEPDDIPPEERTEEFVAALEHAKVSNLEYLTKLQALESAGRDDELALTKLERELRDHIRSEFELPPRPKKAEINRAEHARKANIDPNPELGRVKTKPSHSDAALQTLKFPDELERVLEKIVADAKLSEQEMGISTLFLSFGFLEWYESDNSDKKAFAPLLLLPVTVDVRKAYGRNSFSISATEPSAESNLSLQKLLETEFHRKLPTFDVGDEEGAGSIEAYFDLVQEAIKDLGRWQIHRWLVLGHFAFGRFAVYADLNPANWPTDPAVHPLVGSILRGVDKSFEGDGALIPGDPSDYLIDDPQIEAAAPFLIHDADASQHSAVIDAMKGHNLVIQGPPGTGKSQTIANIVANALAADKTILFVAEKQAALEVVKRRLERAGIGDFCLELHSDKASSKVVLESLQKRLKTTPVTVPAPPSASWHANRKEIAKYLDALHTPRPGGRTPFDLIWKALRGSAGAPSAVDALKTVKFPEDLLNSPSRLSDAEAGLSLFAGSSETFARSFGHPALSPWHALGVDSLQSTQVTSLLECLTSLAVSSRVLAEQITETLDFGVNSLDDLRAVVAAGAALGARTVPESVGVVAQLDHAQLSSALAAARELRAADNAIASHPNVPVQSPGSLRKFTALRSISLPEIYFENAPADLARVARETIDSDLQIKDMLTSIYPALELFHLDGGWPANKTDAIAKAVIVSTKIPAEYRSGLHLNQQIDTTAFANLRDRWARLMSEENSWREKLSLYGRNAWPRPADLEAAAETLRKSSFGKAFAAISGAAKPARELVSSIYAFEDDGAAADLLGTSWDGLDTKFDQIAFGIKARRYFVEQIGPDLTRRLIGISPDGVRNLHQFEGAANSARKTVAKLGSRLDGRSIDLTIGMLADELATMQGVLAVDPEGSLGELTAPVRELAEIATLCKDRDRLQKIIDGSPLKYAVDELSRMEGGIDDAFASIDWLTALRRLTVPAFLLTKLSSPGAPDAWRRTLAIAAMAQTDLQTHDHQQKLLEGEFGIARLGLLEPAKLSETTSELLDHRDELRELLGLYRERRGLETLGLKEFIACADQHRIDPQQLPQLMEAVLAHRGAELAKKSSEALHENTGSSLENRRKQFAERDRAKIRDDRSGIKGKLLMRQPLAGANFGKKKTWTEMALLRNELEKQKRFVPVRALLAQAGRSIQALQPCFMMSPLSLAKFLKAGSLTFDILVIDEASQMRPEDALGAMLRSKQIVVVGDPKQLPPTDFFTRSGDAGPDEDEDFEDLDDESILESCQKTFGHRRPLRWHYRSRCESLIRFSNEQFYRRELVTFPASKPGSFSIDLIRVDGAFQASRNPTEASRIAEEAISFMRHYAVSDEDKIPSLGVVAINLQQRELIREEFNRLRTDDPLVDLYLDKLLSKGEEFFVKNLENVQGDERDFIFVSMTYGREPGGTAMKQRFGPINRKQGHRRLNVLFSRARMRIGLFTSFGSTDVVPSSDSSEGVHILRKYLEYAETRGRVSSMPGSDAESDSDFEVEVAERLRAKGYAVDYQVGVSGYRIDLGVRHPDHLERYLAGIECDGATYHSSKSARDRDRLREEVLVHKGWDIVRVWSTDWFDNPNLETARLIERLEALRNKPAPISDEYAFHVDTPTSGPADDQVETAPLEEPSETPAAPVDDAETGVGISATPSSAGDGTALLSEKDCFQALSDFRSHVIAVEMTDWEPHRSILRDAMIETFVRQRFSDPDEWFEKVPGYLRQGTNPVEKGRYLDRICEIVGKLDRRSTETGGTEFKLEDGHETTKPVQTKLPLGFGAKPDKTVDGKANGADYLTTNFSELESKPEASRFYDRDYEPVLQDMVAHVLRHESPIYEDLLIERIARAHGFQRSGERIQRAVAKVIGKQYLRTKEDGRTVVWGDGSASRLVTYRNCDPDVRSHGDVPIAELASLAVPFIRVRLSDDDILYRMADHFNLGRLREPTRVRFKMAVDLAREAARAPNSSP